MTEPTEPRLDQASTEPDPLLNDVLRSQFRADQILATNFETHEPGKYAMTFEFPEDDKRISVEYVTMNQMSSAALEAAYCAMSAGIRDGAIESKISYPDYLAGKAQSMVGGVYCRFPQRIKPGTPAKLEVTIAGVEPKTTKAGAFLLVRIETKGFLDGHLECLIQQP